MQIKLNTVLAEDQSRALNFYTAGPVTVAVFSDTCGNLFQIYQQ